MFDMCVLLDCVGLGVHTAVTGKLRGGRGAPRASASWQWALAGPGAGGSASTCLARESLFAGLDNSEARDGQPV